MINFRSAKLWEDTPLLGHKLNSVMPADVRIAEVQWVPQDFSARYSAVRKQYIYHLYCSAVMNPLHRGHMLHIPHPLDVPAMR